MKVRAFRIPILVATLLFVALRLAAQAPAPARPLALAAAMPFDPQIAIGQLPNGLRYYVRANKKPEKRAELRLVVKAGSVLEDDDQLGLAHFVEHMNFEGTKNFPKQSLNQFLGSLDRALLVLSDWAQGATFDQDAIDRQRQIVLSEWRMKLGAGERTGEKI